MLILVVKLGFTHLSIGIESCFKLLCTCMSHLGKKWKAKTIFAEHHHFHSIVHFCDFCNRGYAGWQTLFRIIKKNYDNHHWMEIWSCIYKYKYIITLPVCLYVCMSVPTLWSLKLHDHKTWNVGPLSNLDVQGPSGILIFEKSKIAAKKYWTSPISVNLRSL